MNLFQFCQEMIRPLFFICGFKVDHPKNGNEASDRHSVSESWANDKRSGESDFILRVLAKLDEVITKSHCCCQNLPKESAALRRS